MDELEQRHSLDTVASLSVSSDRRLGTNTFSHAISGKRAKTVKEADMNTSDNSSDSGSSTRLSKRIFNAHRSVVGSFERRALQTVESNT